MGLKFKLSIFFTLFSVIFVVAQTDGSKGDRTLEDKITENKQLLMMNPDQAFSQIDDLLKQAKKEENKEGELTLLSHCCWYYNYSSDIKNLILSANLLKQKAVEYKNRTYEATAHTYMLCAYATNRLYEKAIPEFEKTMAILEKEDPENKEIIIVKYNAYTYLANLYKYNGEKEKALQTSLSAYKELSKLKNTELQYHNYAHIASSYIEINLDSAEYYVKKSMEIKPDNLSGHSAFLNYYSLGDIERLRKNYNKALNYYREAEAMISDSTYSNMENRAELFNKMQDVYENLSDTANTTLYRLKSKEAKLQLEQSKNKSLHKILDDTSTKDNTQIYYMVGTIGLVLFLGLLFFIYRLKRKNKSLEEQERISQQYLEDFSKNRPSPNYSELLTLLTKTDPLFITYFEEAFPCFSEKLLHINPSLAPTEIEFCALLKLNLSTKEIAKVQNLQPRSVQSKKYRIRKRLRIPSEIDIYFFFDQL